MLGQTRTGKDDGRRAWLGTTTQLKSAPEVITRTTPATGPSRYVPYSHPEDLDIDSADSLSESADDDMRLMVLVSSVAANASDKRQCSVP